MKCWYCDGDTRVVDSRPTPSSIRRRRVCLRCGLRFSTTEMREAPYVGRIDRLVAERAKFAKLLIRLANQLERSEV